MWERSTDWMPPLCAWTGDGIPQPGSLPARLRTKPATQACAPTGNWTHNPLVVRWCSNQLSHTSQGRIGGFWCSMKCGIQRNICLHLDMLLMLYSFWLVYLSLWIQLYTHIISFKKPYCISASANFYIKLFFDQLKKLYGRIVYVNIQMCEVVHSFPNFWGVSAQKFEIHS